MPHSMPATQCRVSDLGTDTARSPQVQPRTKSAQFESRARGKTAHRRMFASTRDLLNGLAARRFSVIRTASTSERSCKPKHKKKVAQPPAERQYYSITPLF